MSSNFEKIPSGVYKGRVVPDTAQFLHTSKGTEQLVFSVNLVDLNRQVSVYMYFSDAAAPYSLQKLRVCGWRGDDVTNLQGIGDRDINVSIKYEMYDGKERMKTDVMTTKASTDTGNQMNDASKRAFAARLRGLAKATSPLGRDFVNPSALADDEIPF